MTQEQEQTPPFNPRRFIQARILAKQTKRGLAELLGVTERWITNVEAGEEIPPPEILDEISVRFGMVLPTFFFRPDPPNFPMGTLLFHQHGYRRYDDGPNKTYKDYEEAHDYMEIKPEDLE